MTKYVAGLRLKEAAEYIGIKRGKLRDLINNDPDFPLPARLSKRCVILTTKQLDEYLEKKAKQEAEL